MSFAGHAYDAIKRIEYNRSLIKMHRARYQELKDAVSKIKAKHPHQFVDRSHLSDKELNSLKKKIRNQIIKGRRKSLVTSMIFSVAVCVILYFIVRSVFLYFYNN